MCYVLLVRYKKNSTQHKQASARSCSSISINLHVTSTAIYTPSASLPLNWLSESEWKKRNRTAKNTHPWNQMNRELTPRQNKSWTQSLYVWAHFARECRVKHIGPPRKHTTRHRPPPRLHRHGSVPGGYCSFCKLSKINAAITCGRRDDLCAQHTHTNQNKPHTQKYGAIFTSVRFDSPPKESSSPFRLLLRRRYFTVLVRATMRLHRRVAEKHHFPHQQSWQLRVKMHTLCMPSLRRCSPPFIGTCRGVNL